MPPADRPANHPEQADQAWEKTVPDADHKVDQLESLTRIAVRVTGIEASEPNEWLNEAARHVRESLAPNEVAACLDSHQSTDDQGWGGVRMGLSAPSAGRRNRWITNYIDSLIEARIEPNQLWNPESAIVNGAFVPTEQDREVLQNVISVFARRLDSVDLQYAGCRIQTQASPGPRVFWVVLWYLQPIPESARRWQQLLANIARVTASAYTSTLNAGMERRGILLERLTPGQRRVARHMAKGYSKKHIAAKLDRSEHTVHDHIKSIYNSLSVRSRAEFMALWADA